MAKATRKGAASKTAQDLDQAIQRYRTSDLTGWELFHQWKIIRDLSLQQSSSDIESDGVSVDDSY